MLPLTGGGLKSRLAESGELLMPAAESTRVRITVLDGWRCFSIMIVMYGHLADYSSIGYMLRFHGYGMLGVAFFFVISGFVVCTVLTGEFEKASIDLRLLHSTLLPNPASTDPFLNSCVDS